MIEIKTATTDQDIASCWEAMYLLRPQLKQEEFVAQIKALQQEGYTLLFLKAGERAVSVAGYRFLSMLYCGKMAYIDDLSTLTTCRGKGYARMLLDYICELAQKANCKSIQLDSGPSRTNAHRLYYQEHFSINAFHFTKAL